jgi:hypothetical protein
LSNRVTPTKHLEFLMCGFFVSVHEMVRILFFFSFFFQVVGMTLIRVNVDSTFKLWSEWENTLHEEYLFTMVRVQNWVFIKSRWRVSAWVWLVKSNSTLIRVIAGNRLHRLKLFMKTLIRVTINTNEDSKLVIGIPFASAVIIPFSPGQKVNWSFWTFPSLSTLTIQFDIFSRF